jgi:hypothetical protein
VETSTDSEPDIEASEHTKDGEGENFEDPAQIKSCFVGHGVFSGCQRCKSTIEAGIMYYGCHEEQNGWTAACQELSFHHFLGSCVTLGCDSANDEDPFPGYISRTWAEQTVNPQQKSPGSDLGITELAYTQMFIDCNIQATFQISDLYFTPTGRLYQRDSSIDPSHIGSLSFRVSQQPENPNLSDYWTDMLCEREKHTSVYKDMIDWVTGPDDDSDTPHEHEYLPMRPKVPGIRHVNRVVPASEIFRFRTAPFRLEPEWQLDDADVLHASAKVDVARVRGLGIELAGEIIELISSLGRWPGIGTDAHTRVGRTEARLANVVQAWFTLCAVRLSEFPQTVILTKLQEPNQTDAVRPASDTWCDKAQAVLRRFGVHVQGVPGETVFHHAPSKRRSAAEQKKLFQKAGIYQALPYGYGPTQFNTEPLFVDRNFMWVVLFTSRS